MYRSVAMTADSFSPAHTVAPIPLHLGSLHPSVASEIPHLFRQRGASLVDIPLLQPADPFLNVAGEDLRRRIFVTESESGQALCLRPEFTIPVCLNHIAQQAPTPQRYAYLGEVFRQRRADRAEFLQAGIEDIGQADREKTDARIVSDACASLACILPGRHLTITVGDQQIFESVLSSLGLPQVWRRRLLRAFGSRERLARVIAELANPTDLPDAAGSTFPVEVMQDEQALIRHVEAAMQAYGPSPLAGRHPGEIARRLLEKSELRNASISGSVIAMIKRFLTIRAPLEQAEAHLATFAKEAAINLDAAIQILSARVSHITAQCETVPKAHFDAGFGRPLDYYSGFVFEISASESRHTLAGGGRYDQLLSMLGAKPTIPGVGFSLALDRVTALRGETS